jgi:NAD(P)-dependent dehydrogenase (short-subunit alcohol dehydrogenase family)
VAVVTGGSAGLGQAFANRLSADGARVAIADIADGTRTVNELRAAGGDGIAVLCDVSEAEDVRAMAEATTKALGDVDILVHNAGIYPLASFSEMTFEEWRRVLAVNLDSIFHLAQAFLPGMRERGWGRVICVASNTFHAGAPGLTHYVASKGGLIGFVRSLAAEVGDEGVTVNALAPSLMRTKGTTEGPHEEMGLFELVASGQAIKRTQRPEDVVGTLSFLASDEAAFVTGQTLVVDGGWVRA